MTDDVKNHLQYEVTEATENECGDIGVGFCVIPLQGDNDKNGQCVLTTDPISLSAAVIKYILDVGKMHLHDDPVIEGAVVAVPAHFQLEQKHATLLASERAGIPNVHLLQEPVAAALAYGINGGTDGETVLVFDWGGGTFDVSVIQAFEGIMEILGTDGDQFLGGDDIDGILAHWLLSEKLKINSWDGYTLKEAMRQCRFAKERLAVKESTFLKIQGKEVELHRTDLEIVCRPLFEKIASVLDRIGKELFISWNIDPFSAIVMKGVVCTQQAPARGATDPWAPPPRRITQVVLVGQITRLPMVRRFVEQVTGIIPRTDVDPGEAVALGAATQAGILEGSVCGVELMDGSYSVDLHDRATGFSNWQP